MRILHFYKVSYPDSQGGVEQVIHQLAKGSAQRDHHVDVLSLTSSNTLKRVYYDGYYLHQIKSNFQIASTPFSLKAFSYFKKLAKQADIIHFHYPWPFMDLVFMTSNLKKPTVVSYHSDIIKQKNLLKLYNPLKKIFLKKVNKIIASSPNYVRSSAELQTYLDKVEIIPYGIDNSNYCVPTHEKLDYWKKILGNQFFLFIGVLRYYKSVDTLIQAASNVSFPIVIAGTGPLESQLKKQVFQLKLKNVIFLGKVSEEDKSALLTLCYGLVFPSSVRSEAFGISLLEGAMFAKPLISCQIETGTSYVNLNGVTGITIPPSDPVALKNAMEFLWNNPDKASEMGKNAKERYKQLFSAEKMINNYVTLYRSIINQKV